MSNKHIQINRADFYTNDEPTQFNNPWVRVIINVISAAILGINFDQINNSYFVAMIIFTIPILLDYLRFRPAEKLRRLFHFIGKCLVFIVLFISVLGIVGVFSIESFDDNPHILVQEGYVIASGFHLPAIILWLTMALNVFISVIDTFTARYEAEQKLTKL